MYYLLPASLKWCLEERERVSFQPFDIVMRYLLEAFSELGMRPSLCKSLSRTLQCFGVRADDGLTPIAYFREKLEQSDDLLEAELAGFARLFDSICESELINNDAHLEFDALDETLQALLMPLYEAKTTLERLDELCMSLDLSASWAAQSIFFDAWVKFFFSEDKQGKAALRTWVVGRCASEENGAIFDLREGVTTLHGLIALRGTPFLKSALLCMIARSKWPSSFSVEQNWELVNILLREENLPPLSVFKEAGFFSGDAQVYSLFSEAKDVKGTSKPAQ